ncbi:MAG TPA: MgtC/SapB family protein, partial [Albitalea sp.]|nr:MgtC/SapB family protein [Albitalea sp.]
MPVLDSTTPAQWLGLAVALGAGLLVGLERERRKGHGATRAAAGIRSFALASASGALAQMLGMPGVVIAGALFVAALGAVSHWKSRSSDPGLTTELALFTTYLIGVQTVISPLLGAACAAALTMLLAARTRLHRFSTRVLSEQELHDGVLLAALALIVLPLAPSQPLAWLGGLNPRILI